MKAIAVSSRSKTLNDLLKKAQRKSVILQDAEGRCFVLASIQDYEAFEVGEDVTKNKKLMKFLAERRSNEKTIPLSEVKARLGLK
ncbi:MAG: hypothetical protein ACREJ4_16975 [Candidatus Methylomirabilaceae bacterium]